MFYQNPPYEVSMPRSLLLKVVAAHSGLLLWKIAFAPKEAKSLEAICLSSQVSLKPMKDYWEDTEAHPICHKVGPTLWCNSCSRALSGIMLKFVSEILFLFNFPLLFRSLHTPLSFKCFLSNISLLQVSLSQALLIGILT